MATPRRVVQSLGFILNTSAYFYLSLPLHKIFFHLQTMSIRRRHGRSYKGLHIDCNLPEAEWILLMDEVKKAVRNPVNSVALEDPKQSGHWEAWLDSFIDGGIGERFFGTGNMSKKWIFEVDRAAVRAFMKLLVLLVSSRERKSNHRQILFDSQREGSAVSATTTVMTSQEEVRIQDGLDETEHADVEKGKKVDRLEGQGKQDEMREDILFGDTTPPGYFPTNKLPETEFVFQTRLFDSNKVKFLYANDTISLQSFLGEVHNKFGLGHNQGIESFEAQIGNNIYVVDTPDERDWQQIMKIARRIPAAPEIVAKVIRL